MRVHDRTQAMPSRGVLMRVAAVCALGLAALALPRAFSPTPLALAQESAGPGVSALTSHTLLPERMNRIGSARQLIVATGRKLGATTGTLQFFDYVNGAWVCNMSVPCRFGKRGLMDGAHRWAGNKTTPTGIWTMPGYVFGTHRRAATGTMMRYRRITSKSWWSDRKGRTYNDWVEARRWRGERLANAPVQYEYAVSTGYNARPNHVVYGRGTGIFLHIYGRGLTAGCVSISRRDMIGLSKLLDPAKHPAFAIGTLATGTRTDILAY